MEKEKNKRIENWYCFDIGNNLMLVLMGAIVIIAIVIVIKVNPH